jgi:hypothetical protein
MSSVDIHCRELADPPHVASRFEYHFSPEYCASQQNHANSRSSSA